MNRLRLKTNHVHPSHNGGKIKIKQAKAKVVQAALEWFKTFGSLIPEAESAEDSLFKATVELVKLQGEES
jgi:hypothetical protein